LRAAPLRERVLAGSRLWSGLTVVAETGSTNDDLVAAARAGAAEGTILVAGRQTRGRGRLGRAWVSEPGTALTFSVLLRPAAVPASARGWLPLLTGVAVAAAVRGRTGLDVSLKWPNDVLARAAAAGTAAPAEGKLAGILAEQSGDAIVVGIGLNVLASPDGLTSSLPATPLAELGAGRADPEELLAAILAELELWYLRWAGGAAPGGAAPGGAAPGDAAASGLRAEYVRACSTIGRTVRVELPGGASLSGRAADVDSLGRLLVDGPDGVQPVSAGDVVHVR
jgi:BirA family transcriptional regulator, biotin operon repressor / biotin---[acetyl-CoA-carboxylase] ligase